MMERMTLYIGGIILGFAIGFMYGMIKLDKEHKKELEKVIMENDVIGKEFKKIEDEIKDAIKNKVMMGGLLAIIGLLL